VVPERFELACGSAAAFLPALCLGAPAGVLAVACCAPGPTAALYRALAGLGGRATRAPLLPVPAPVREELRALRSPAESG
jgi:dihydrodipicolinate synthase/N-acetylneuraminate lyase